MFLINLIFRKTIQNLDNKNQTNLNEMFKIEQEILETKQYVNIWSLSVYLL